MEGSIHTREALDELTKARQEIERLLEKVRDELKALPQANSANSEQQNRRMVELQDKHLQEIAGLNSQIQTEREKNSTLVGSLQQELGQEKGKRIAAENKVQSIQAEVQDSAREFISRIFQALGQESPLSQLSTLEKERGDNLVTIDSLRAELGTLKEKNSNTERELGEKKTRISELEGSVGMYKEQSENFPKEKEAARLEAVKELVEGLLKNISLQRMEKLLGAGGDSEDITGDQVITAQRLVEYLQKFQELRITHKIGQRVKVAEQDLVTVYELEEEYDPGVEYEVSSPGFADRYGIVVNPRIRPSKEVEHE
jgi:chromosome segregation ATPase